MTWFEPFGALTTGGDRPTVGLHSGMGTNLARAG